MLNPTSLQTFRFNAGIDKVIDTMVRTSSKIASCRRDLAELNRRVRDREADLADVELPVLEETSKNGKNSTQRKILFRKLCAASELWKDARRIADDAIHHRDMVQAELDGLTARFSAQRHASDLITATLNASSE